MNGDGALADKSATAAGLTDGAEARASASSTAVTEPPAAPANGSTAVAASTAEQTTTQIDTTALANTSPVISKTLVETKETTPTDATVAPASSLPARPSVTALVDAEADELLPAPDASASAAGQPLEFDWEQLVASGFVDPRDRARPLSKAMNEIIRALIRQALSDQSSWRDRVILVTSPAERSSKTAASINFAFGLTTIANHRVVVVDVATVGLGAVGRLGGGDRVGVAAALADESIAIDDLPIRTDLDRLTLVASGSPDEDTLDRFASRRMLDILRFLTKDPDTILIIDAPPILLSQEAAVLSVVAGQVVMSVEAGRTTADQIEHALQRIGERHNVSLVLNESSGMAADDVPAASGSGDPAPANRRTPSGSRRRLPRTAAAATIAAVLAFFGAGSTGLAFSDLDDLLLPAAPAVSTSIVPLPERWPMESAQFGTSCRQDCR
ncbi:MAG: hypothetical protein ACR2RA_16435 [Geminicoccaceae bacterium]